MAERTDLILTRHSYAPTETMGELALPSGEVLQTIEPPWVWDEAAGSKPFESCVPDGPYDLVPHNGTDWQDTWALVNPALRVWHQEQDMDGPGRYACLCHAGNWSNRVVGCIAPGVARTVMQDPRDARHKLAVTQSQVAMNKLRAALGGPDATGYRLIIQPHPGARISRDG